MAKQAGIIRIRGTIAGMNFFKANGQYFAGEQTGVDAETVATSPLFELTRQNDTEFQGMQIAAVAVMNCFERYRFLRSRYLRANLIPTLKNIQLQETDPRGQRGLSWHLSQPAELIGFTGKPGRSFASAFTGAVTVVPTGTALNSGYDMDWVDDIDLSQLTYPVGANALQIDLFYGIVPLVGYNAATFKFEARTDPSGIIIGATTGKIDFSTLPFTQSQIQAITLTADLPDEGGSCAIAVAAITFYQKVGSDYNLMPGGGGASIIAANEFQ